MKRKIKCLKKDSENFPIKLKELTSCPKELFVLGDEKILSEFSLSIVGSRKCSILGKETARQISEGLSNHGIPIISGFARGIDTVAHKVCIEQKNKTIVVLGGGFGKIYPSENKYLIDDILKNGGVIISEYPYEYPTLRKNFIERNRIIAALSEGIILIEAKANSGSLHTVKYAKKLEKKVFAVPGSINDEKYEGSNAVLAEGGFCVRNVEDILSKYDFFDCETKKNTNKKVDINYEYLELFNVLSKFPMSLTEICLKLNKPTSKILYQLTMLEIDGFIKRGEGQTFMKVK